MSNRRWRTLLVGSTLPLALLVPTSAPADNPVLTGTVGPGFTIALKNADGSLVQHVDAGTYTIVVHDLSALHSFHLTGPGGVNAQTEIDGVGDSTFTVTLGDGRYEYICDAHPTTMKGVFTVGSVTTPPPSTTPKPKARTLAGSVGPGARISLGTAATARLSTIKAGAYTITVRDRTSADNFHLSGPGVERKTGVRFKGTATWKVTLRKGKLYRYRSDRHPALRGTLRAT